MIQKMRLNHAAGYFDEILMHYSYRNIKKSTAAATCMLLFRSIDVQLCPSMMWIYPGSVAFDLQYYKLLQEQLQNN